MPLKYMPGGLINVADPGIGFTPVVPGEPDSWAKLKAISDAMAPNTTVLLNAGSYALSQPWDFYTGIKTSAHVDHLWLRGAGMTRIVGNFAGPLVAYNRNGVDATSDARVSGIEFQNSHASGIGLQLERIEKGILAALKFTACAQGLVIGAIQATNVDIDLYDIDLNGSLASFPNGVGLAARMIGRVFGIRATQWGTACRVANHVDFFGGRIEECNIGIRTGVTPGDAEYSTVVSIIGMTNESTVRNVQMGKGTTSLSIHTYQSHGTGNGVLALNPTIGIDCQAGSGRISLQNAQISGSFSTAAVALNGGGPAVLINSSAGIKAPAAGVPWLVGMDPAQVYNLGSNYP